MLVQIEMKDVSPDQKRRVVKGRNVVIGQIQRETVDEAATPKGTVFFRVYRASKERGQWRGVRVMTCFAAMMRSLTSASVSPVCAIGLILNRRMRWTRAQTDSTEKGKVLGQLRITHDGGKGEKDAPSVKRLPMHARGPDEKGTNASLSYCSRNRSGRYSLTSSPQ